MSNYLDSLKKEMESEAGSWNGEESGLAEDKADAANDIIDIIDDLQESVKNFYEI